MMKKWLPWAIKLALSALIVWYLFAKIDLGAAWQRGKGIDLGLLTVAFLFMVAQVGVATWRWMAVIKAMEVPLGFASAFRIMFIGLFFNLVLPSSVGGDAVRMWKARKSGLSLSASVNSVMLERLVTVLGLVFLVVITEPLLFSRINDVMALATFPVLAICGIVGTAILMYLDRLPENWRHWKIVRGLALLAADTRKLFLRPAHAAGALGISMFGHANISLIAWILARGLNIDITLVDCLVLIPPVMLITTLPISIAGWGVREGAMVAILGFVGVASDAALVLSVIFGLVSTVACLPGGIIWLVSSDRKEALKAAEMEVTDDPRQSAP
jgi:uncharacterized membrane protein YbhN (UPF0104 family)